MSSRLRPGDPQLVPNGPEPDGDAIFAFLDTHQDTACVDLLDVQICLKVDFIELLTLIIRDFDVTNRYSLAVRLRVAFVQLCAFTAVLVLSPEDAAPGVKVEEGL